MKRSPQAPYAVSSFAWCITYPVGHHGESRIDIGTIRHTRNTAISSYLAILGNGDTWRRRRRTGERCVRVIIAQERP